MDTPLNSAHMSNFSLFHSVSSHSDDAEKKITSYLPSVQLQCNDSEIDSTSVLPPYHHRHQPLGSNFAYLKFPSTLLALSSIPASSSSTSSSASSSPSLNLPASASSVTLSPVMSASSSKRIKPLDAYYRKEKYAELNAAAVANSFLALHPTMTAADATAAANAAVATTGGPTYNSEIQLFDMSSQKPKRNINRGLSSAETEELQQQDALHETVEKRHKRQQENRFAARRSRERKRAYMLGLEVENQRLVKENVILKNSLFTVLQQLKLVEEGEKDDAIVSAFRRNLLQSSVTTEVIKSHSLGVNSSFGSFSAAVATPSTTSAASASVSALAPTKRKNSVDSVLSQLSPSTQSSDEEGIADSAMTCSQRTLHSLAKVATAELMQN